MIDMKPKAMLAAASISLIVLSQHAEATVTWLVSDNGTDLTLQTSGSLDMGVDSGSVITFSPEAAHLHDSDGTILSEFETTSYVSQNGTFSGNTTGSLLNDPVMIHTGDAFGLHTNSEIGLMWDDRFGITPGTLTPVTTLVITGHTVASAFGSNLDAGPIVLWTHNLTGDTVNIALASSVAPEPSSTALLGLGGLALMLRRRR